MIRISAETSSVNVSHREAYNIMFVLKQFVLSRGNVTVGLKAAIHVENELSFRQV